MSGTLKVIDFFCGAGGFSEGFRQQGFKLVKGIDNWRPAIQTHNLNHGLKDDVGNVLDYEQGTDKIYELPDTEIIVGSPPCVNFSMSNRAGKADKSLGVRLIEAYLRVVAVKKHQPNSVLQAWLMENVPNSRNYVREIYTFDDLNLGEWAIQMGKDPQDEALRVKNNGGYFVAADYGSPQSRQRFICGEIIATGHFPEPKQTHAKTEDIFGMRSYVTLGDIKKRIPSPVHYAENEEWTDPNYPCLKVPASELTDHFYDTGLYTVEWELARAAKINHPFMGKMSFPEDESKPSRTIMATRSASTREAIIFRSEHNRKGNGEYRLPTIREAATLMGFPFTYQFVGGEGTKWRLIGNAVCPHMSAALAKAIRRELGLGEIRDENIDFSDVRGNFEDGEITNLNAPGIKIRFDAPPKKKKGAKFRSHPFKIGNMTVALTNFDPEKGSSSETNGRKWYCSIFLGSGKDFSTVRVTPALHVKADKLIDRLPDGKDFKHQFEQHFKGRIANASTLQSLLEQNKANDGKVLGPVMLVEEIGEFIETYDSKSEMLSKIALDGIRKELFPKRQLLAVWAIGKVAQQK